ncbi:hypothetical protein [Prescottella subtropica]|uniref:hypothetical protein n=1 Tax=Prescottella subtropica TaxID=2545757 RepID=UPI0010FA318C|nr:hypothetical protein [Prescottella subtropica]
MSYFENEHEIRNIFSYRFEPVAWSGQYEGPGSTFGLYILEDQDSLNELASEVESKGSPEGVADEIRDLKGYWVIAGPDEDFHYFSTKAEAIAFYEELDDRYQKWIDGETGDDN